MSAHESVIKPGPLIRGVDPTARLRKKVVEARRLAELSPAETIRMGSDLTMFALELAEAAEHAKLAEVVQADEWHDP